MGLVRVVQSLPTRLVLTILHKFLMNLMSGSSQANQQSWYLALVKLLHFFCRMTGSQILLKDIPSSYKRPFHFSNRFLSRHLALFFRIHHPCNRVK